MSDINNGGPAFPTGTWEYDGQNNVLPYQAGGMTLRDYFAAKAPEPPASWRGGDRSVPDLIAWRWWYADAMLKARKK